MNQRKFSIELTLEGTVSFRIRKVFEVRPIRILVKIDYSELDWIIVINTNQISGGGGLSHATQKSRIKCLRFHHNALIKQISLFDYTVLVMLNTFQLKIFFTNNYGKTQSESPQPARPIQLRSIFPQYYRPCCSFIEKF